MEFHTRYVVNGYLAETEIEITREDRSKLIVFNNKQIGNYGKELLNIFTMKTIGRNDDRKFRV